MANPLGVVNTKVEISMENHILVHIRQAKKYALNKNMDAAKHLIRNVILVELNRLEGLEGRESGQRRYIELKEVERSKDYLELAWQGLASKTAIKFDFGTIIDYFDKAIREVVKLKKLDLKLG